MNQQLRKHDKTALLAKTNLNTIKVLISRALIDSYISYEEFVLANNVLSLFRMGLFGAAYGWREVPLTKICHACPIVMKIGTVIPYLKRIQNIYKSDDTTLEFCSHQHFIMFEFLKVVFISMVAILMMSVKLATAALIKIQVFWNKSYGVASFVHDIINKTLSCDLNYFVDVMLSGFL